MLCASANCVRAVLFALVVCANLPVTLAQSPHDSAPTDTPTPDGSGIEEAQPAVFAFKDEKTGKLVLTPGWTLDKLQKLLNLELNAQQGEGLPAFVLESMTTEGHVSKGLARLQFGFEINTHVEGWVRIPLRLGELYIDQQQPLAYQGPAGEHVLGFDDDTGEYFLALEAKPKQKHTFSLAGFVPVKNVGGVWRLECSVPRATRSSRLMLTVPQVLEQKPQASVGMLEMEPEEGSTQLTVTGFSGDFRLTWQEPSETVGTRPVHVAVTGALLARVDGQSVNTTTRLNLRALGGGQFQSFKVRLPRGATLATNLGEGYTAQEETGDKKEARRVVAVRMNSPASRFEAQLVTQQTHDVAQPDTLVELVGFEVFDVQQPGGEAASVVQQSGQLAIQVIGNWQVIRKNSPEVHQIIVDELPANLRQGEVRDAYAYFKQPSELKVRIIPRETRISVDPEYVFEVRPDRIDATITLQYTIRGAAAFELGIDLAGWKVDAGGIGPASLVDSQRTVFEELSPLAVRLLQPSTGKLTLVVRARRPLEPDNQQVSFSLPQPVANTIGPAGVAVFAADNVELLPRTAEMTALVRQETGPRLKPAGGPYQQQALYYRGTAADAQFVADREVHVQEVLVEADGSVIIGLESGEVEQIFNYDVRYEPLSKLLFDVPAELAQPDRLQIFRGQERLQPTVARPEKGGAVNRLRMQVPLSQSQPGQIDLRLRYSVPWEPLPADATRSIDLPLVMPLDGQLKSNRLSVEAVAGIGVQARGESWQRGEPASQNNVQPAADLHLRSTALQPFVPLAASLHDEQMFESTVIERAWLQSYLAGPRRQDRVVLRVSTTRDSFELRLPDGVAREDRVFVDGRPVRSLSTPQGTAIPLPGATGTPTTHVVELSYHFPEAVNEPGELELAPPAFPEHVWLQQTYWQVVLPADWHLVSQQGYTPEYVWDWRGWLPGRRPLKEQFQLETWSGGSHQQDFTSGTSTYLFSENGGLPTLSLRAESRSWLVLYPALVVLTLGLLLIYVPRLRRPDFLFVAAILAVVLAALFPEPMLVVLTGAAMGLGLVLLALVIERIVGRRRRRLPGWSTSSSSINHGSTGYRLREGNSTSGSTAEASLSQLSHTDST